MKILNLILIGCSMIAGAVSEGETEKLAHGVPRAQIPVIPGNQLPVIDGVIGAAEWKNALKFAGFEIKDKGVSPGKTEYLYVTSDGENLCLAVRTNTPNLDPGGGLITRQTERDSPVYQDDSIELILYSGRKGTEIFQFVFNSRGVCFDQKLAPGRGNGDPSWNAAGLQVGSTAQSGWWELEVKIPMKEIACKGSFRMNVIRNWNGSLRTALSQTRRSFEVGNMGIFELKKGTPLIRCEEIGRPGEGEWDLRFSAARIPEGKIYHMAALLLQYRNVRTDGVMKREKKYVRFESRDFSRPGELSLRYSVKDRDEHALFLAVTEKESGRLVFRRRIRAKKGESVELFPPTLKFELPEGFGYGTVWYYPGYGKAAVRVTALGNFEPEKIEIAGENGSRAVAEKKDGSFLAEIPVPLEQGKYTFHLRMTGKHGEKKEFRDVFSLRKKKFAWEGNKLGTEKVILPPFESLKSQGNTVSAIFRKHAINASGVWDSFESKGRELLARPMFFESEIEGRRTVFQGTPKSVQVKYGGYEAAAENSASAGGITLSSSSRMEYDGFYWVDFTLNGIGRKSLDRLTLNIPFREEEATLFHAVVNGIRSNPGGNIPQGSGTVWDGSRLPRPTVFGREIIHPQLIPYIWVGTEERGISFFLESSFGMKLRRDVPALRLVRRNGMLILEADIINRKAQLKDGHTFSFGLHGTPVKPVPRWAYSLTHDNSATRLVPGMRNMFNLAHMLVGYPAPWARHPVAYDYTAMRAMTQFLKTGGANREEATRILDEWEMRHRDELSKALSLFPHPRNSKKTYQSHRSEAIAADRRVTFQNITAPTLFYRYSDPRLSSQTLEEDLYFRSEWSRMPIGYPTCYRSFLTRTNLDYTVYCYALDMENGQSGIYLDDTFIMPNFNPATAARIDDEGELHSSMGLLAGRELVKRLAVLQHKHRFSPRYLEVHMTNALLIPCFSFATAQLGWESKFNEKLFQKKYPADYIRAVNIGNKLGAESIILPGAFRTVTDQKTWRKEKRMLKLTRSQLAMILPHDLTARLRWRSPDKELDRDLYFKVQKILADFGVAREGTEFLPYWEHAGLVPGAPPEAMISAWKRPGKVLLVIGNRTGKEIRMRWNPDEKRMGIQDGCRWMDMESGMPLEDNVICLGGNDFRIMGTQDQGGGK